MRALIAILFSTSFLGCAAYTGSGLRPGEAQLNDVLGVMGQPAMHWREADGSVQLSFPRGPMGVHSYMVYLGPDGRLQRIENVLDPKGFARVRAKHDTGTGPPYSWPR